MKVARPGTRLLKNAREKARTASASLHFSSSAASRSCHHFALRASCSYSDSAKRRDRAAAERGEAPPPLTAPGKMAEVGVTAPLRKAVSTSQQCSQHRALSGVHAAALTAPRLRPVRRRGAEFRAHQRPASAAVYSAPNMETRTLFKRRFRVRASSRRALAKPPWPANCPVLTDARRSSPVPYSGTAADGALLLPGDGGPRQTYSGGERLNHPRRNQVGEVQGALRSPRRHCAQSIGCIRVRLT